MCLASRQRRAQFVETAHGGAEFGDHHAGAYDLSFLRCVPNMVIAAPSDENECRLLLSTCYALDCPSAVRYPRGSGSGAAVNNTLDTVPVGKGIIRRQGKGTDFKSTYVEKSYKKERAEAKREIKLVVSH